MSTPETPKQVELLETVRKKRAALEARLRKEPLRVIADNLGVSVGTVRTWIKEMTQTYLPQEEIEELRAHEANSLDESEVRVMKLMEMVAKTASERAAMNLPYGHQVEQLERFEVTLSNIRKQRALLLGLNTPVQVKHNITVRTEFDAEVEALVSDLLGGGNVMTPPDMVDTGSEDV